MKNKSKVANDKNQHVEYTLSIYKRFDNEMEQLRVFSMEKEKLEFEQIVRTAYVKCYDFIIYCCTTKEIESSFFRLPGLRSLCEDLITLNYLKHQSQTEISRIIHGLSAQEIYESILVQEKFINKYNPAQIILPSNLIPQQEKEKLLNKYSKKKKWQNMDIISLPSVYKMAKEYGLEDLYNYMYHATSKAVHFSIDTMLKMGWGNLDIQTERINGKASYKHYYRYYHDFSVFYASYIFIKQTESFKTVISISDSLIKETTSLMKEYEKIDWPELTTFDQMNIKGPDQITRSLTRSIFNLNNEEYNYIV